MEYIFQVFLLVPGSADRIISALVSEGWTVEPWIKEGKSVVAADGKEDASASMCIRVFSNLDKLTKKEYGFRTLLKRLQVPYFGYAVWSKDEGGGYQATRIDNGYLPPVERKLDQGPYRSNGLGTVVQFPTPDNGIIDE